MMMIDYVILNFNLLKFTDRKKQIGRSLQQP